MRRALLLLAGAALVLTSCASEDVEERPRPPPRREGAPGGSRGPGPPNLFISPAGEPFHGKAGEPYASAAWFKGADTDGDGKLTLSEFSADAERAFRRYDTDGNGLLDGFEIADYEAKIAPEILPRIGRLRSGEGQDESLFEGRRRGGGGRGGPGGRGGRGGGGEAQRPHRLRAGDDLLSGAAIYAMLNEPEPLRAADTDLDGRVSLAEWRAKTKRRFALLDTKGTGALLLAELPKTAVQEAADRRAARREAAPPPRRTPERAP